MLPPGSLPGLNTPGVGGWRTAVKAINLSGLGAASTDSAQLLRDLAVKYTTLKGQIIAANYAKSPPVLSETNLNSNIASMDRVYAEVMGGKFERSQDLLKTALGILHAVRAPEDSIIGIDDILMELSQIPKRLADAVVSTAKTAGDAVRATGIDPAAATDSVKWLAAGVGVAASVALILKFAR